MNMFAGVGRPLAKRQVMLVNMVNRLLPGANWGFGVTAPEESNSTDRQPTLPPGPLPTDRTLVRRSVHRSSTHDAMINRSDPLPHTTEACQWIAIAMIIFMITRAGVVLMAPGVKALEVYLEYRLKVAALAATTITIIIIIIITATTAVTNLASGIWFLESITISN
ncbi:hypothetical protein J3F84DRAFT_403299 [Trichoderma pleuroticola]